MIDQNHIRTGNTFLRSHTFILGCQPVKIIPCFHLRVNLILVIENLSCHCSKLDFITRSIDFLRKMNCIKSIELFQPVQMPPAAAELSICDKWKAMLHFFFNQLCNLLVLNLFQIFSCDCTTFKLCSRFFNCLRTEERTYNIILYLNHIKISFSHVFCYPLHALHYTREKKI